MIATINLVAITCHKCAGVYGLAERFNTEKREAGGDWHCPYCKVCTAYCESEADKLRKRLAREEALRADAEGRVSRERERHEHTQRRLSATQGVVTKVRKRVGKGACPCCNRHFANVERHMATKHPDYANPEAQ